MSSGHRLKFFWLKKKIKAGAAGQRCGRAGPRREWIWSREWLEQGMAGYLGNALFQDLLVDVKETSCKGVPFDGARGGNIF